MRATGVPGETTFHPGDEVGIVRRSVGRETGGASRTVQGAGAETFQYDTIGRLVGHTGDLGAFTLGYLGQTGQIASRQRTGSTLATAWSYLNNTGDRRLAGVANTGLVAGHFSNFTFTSTPEDFVAGVAETSDATAVYPPTGSQSATYNSLNQLTVLSGQALTWDTVGNLTSDGQRTYTWDAENRLVGIGYPGQSGKATAFAYDGLGRRVAITETPPGGGTPVTTSYLWCGDALCQARDGSNVPTRSYYDEGEFVAGAPGQPYFYGIDQLGSVRRAFASASSAPAFNYDPYGVPLSGPAPVTDFGFAGLFNHTASGLNLTLYRAYDPVAGRWLSRDPLEEESDPSSNLYAYVAGNPISLTDTLGLGPQGMAIGGVIGGTIGAIIGGGAGVACGVGAPGCVPIGAVEGGVLGAGVGAAVGNTVEETLSLMAKKSDKERSTDVPSWVKGRKPKKGQSGKEFADEALDEKYGKGKYKTGPGSEHSKIKKWVDRGCK